LLRLAAPIVRVCDLRLLSQSTADVCGVLNRCANLFHSTARIGSRRRAFETFDSFEHLGVTPTADTYNALMQARLASRACAASPCLPLPVPLPAVVLLVPRLKQRRPAGTGSWRQCCAISSCFNHPVGILLYRLSVLQGCIQRGRVETALKVFEHMESADVQPNAFTHRQLVEAGIVSGGWVVPG